MTDHQANHDEKDAAGEGHGEKKTWKDPTLNKISAAMGTKGDPTMATSNDPSTYKVS